MTEAHMETRPGITGAGTPASRQVDWYETYAYASRLADAHGLALDHQLPVAGSLGWCGMPDTDARKLLSLVLRGVQAAVADDARQEALADASREISTAAGWSAVAQRVRNGRGSAYTPRRKEIA